MEPLFLVKRSHLPTYCLKYDFSGDCILSAFASRPMHSLSSRISILYSNVELEVGPPKERKNSWGDGSDAWLDRAKEQGRWAGSGVESVGQNSEA